MSRFSYAMKINCYKAQSKMAAAGERNLSSIMANLSEVADASGKLLNNSQLTEEAELKYFRDSLLAHLNFEQSMGSLTADEMERAVKMVTDFTALDNQK